MDETPSIREHDEYVAIFTGGPNDGRADTRVATEDAWDTEITVNGLEEAFPAQFVYRASGARSVGDKVHVTYVWDPAESDDLLNLDPLYESDQSKTLGSQQSESVQGREPKGPNETA